MIENLKETDILGLKKEVAELKNRKYRFVTCSCADNRDGSFDLFYHFDKEYKLVTLKIKVTQEDIIPSVSDLYFCAFLVENEMNELYGLKIEDIVIDYGGKMYMTADSAESPMTYGANITIERRNIGYEE
ncbi:MAG: NADH-quinone oxidoreductase subunit C [Armatimonadetes bacterium]|nr:NADH-quinone oxidoreductase subunit C [Candidatus Hippobium faecium]